MKRSHRFLMVISMAVLLIGTAACSGSDSPTSAANQGQLRVVVHDEPSQQITEAHVTFSSVQARMTDGTLVDLSGAVPTTIDILTLTGGATFELAADAVPAGDYDALIVTISAVSLTLADGTTVDITLPGDGTEAVIPESFSVVEGQSTVITLDFRADLSFEFNGTEFEFHPEIDCDGVEHEGGSHS